MLDSIFLLAPDEIQELVSLMWNGTLPIDVIALIAASDFAVVNSIGRTCSALASRITAIGTSFARTELLGYRRGHLNISRLPNGMNHGISTFDTNNFHYYCRLSFEYDRGKPIRMTESNINGVVISLTEIRNGMTLYIGQSCCSINHDRPLVRDSLAVKIRSDPDVICALSFDEHAPDEVKLTWGGRLDESITVAYPHKPPMDPFAMDELLAWHDELVPVLRKYAPWYMRTGPTTPAPMYARADGIYNEPLLLPGVIADGHIIAPIDDVSADLEYVMYWVNGYNENFSIDQNLYTHWTGNAATRKASGTLGRDGPRLIAQLAALEHAGIDVSDGLEFCKRELPGL